MSQEQTQPLHFPYHLPTDPTLAPPLEFLFAASRRNVYNGAVNFERVLEALLAEFDRHAHAGKKLSCVWREADCESR